MSHCEALIDSDGMTAAAQCFWLTSETLADQGSTDGNNMLADDARIVITRYYPDGRTQTVEMKGADMKNIASAVGCLAKARGDRATYSDTTFEEDPDGSVLISTTRYSHTKNHSSPASFRIAQNERGKLQIVYMELETVP